MNCWHFYDKCIYRNMKYLYTIHGSYVAKAGLRQILRLEAEVPRCFWRLRVCYIVLLPVGCGCTRQCPVVAINPQLILKCIKLCSCRYLFSGGTFPSRCFIMRTCLSARTNISSGEKSSWFRTASTKKPGVHSPGKRGKQKTWRRKHSFL